jgi:hypothetical protein
MRSLDVLESATAGRTLYVTSSAAMVSTSSSSAVMQS